MNKVGKIAPIIVILACLGSLYLAYTLAGIKKTQADKIAELDSSLNTTTAALNKTKSTLKQTEADLTKTKSDLDQANTSLQTTKAALDQKIQEADGLKTQLTTATQELGQAKTQLATAQDSLKKIQEGLVAAGLGDLSSIDKVRDKIVSLSDENKVLGQQLTAKQTENQQLKLRIEDLTTTPVGVRGHVSFVQGKWGFLVLDVGTAQHVRPNTEFLVYRDSKFVGKVQVVSVANYNSIAQILPEYLKRPPIAGDLAVH
jgi:multidrug efflux pump subunit AcrA (membrane-fusion protein)